MATTKEYNISIVKRFFPEGSVVNGMVSGREEHCDEEGYPVRYVKIYHVMMENGPRIDDSTGFVANSLGLEFRNGKSRGIVVRGGGFCAIQHVVDEMAFLMFGDPRKLEYSVIT